MGYQGELKVWRFDSGPWAAVLTAFGFVEGYQAEWRYFDSDGFPQAAYRIALFQGAVEKYDTGWIEAAAKSHVGEGIVAGDYTLTLELRNSKGVENGPWETAITVGSEAPEPVDEPPTATIKAPAQAATVEGTVAVSLAGTDDLGISWARLLIDGNEVAAWQLGGLGTFEWQGTHSWDTTYASNGQHVLTLLVTDNAGQMTQAQVNVTVANEEGGIGGTEPPTVAITAPLNGATVSEDQTITVEATDDAGLAAVRIFIDGAEVKEWLPGGEGVLTWTRSWTWDTLNYGNGTHELSATAVDTNGNQVTHTISVTVDNSQLVAPKHWFSELWSVKPDELAGEIAEMVTADRQIARVMISAVITEHATPENNAGLQFGFHIPGTSWDFDDYQTVIPEALAYRATAGQDGRHAIKFSPLVAWQNWAVNPSNVIDVQVVTEQKLVMLTPGPPIKLFWWNGVDAVASYLDFTGTWAAGYTGVCFRILDDKLFIGALTDDATAQPVVLVQDLDTAYDPLSSNAYAIEFASRNPHEITDMVIAGDAIYFGTDDGLGHGGLWKIEGEDVSFISDVIPSIRSLWVDKANGVWIGGADGKVYQGIAEDYNTAQDNVNAGLAYGAGHFALTGSAGKVYRKTGETWALLATASITEPAVLATYRNRLWVGGNGDDLFCYDFNLGIWQHYGDITGWSAITAMTEFAGVLCVFGTGAANLFKALTITNAHLMGRYVDEIGLQIVDTEPTT